MSLTGHFIDGGAGRILVVVHEPASVANGNIVLIVPAFGEEMNKSRRLVFETAHALTERGYAAIVPDLYGTGDSEGEFSQSDWDIWLRDLSLVVEWAKQWGDRSFHALLVRFGAALFAAAQSGFGVQFDGVVAWQPVLKGKDQLGPMLRMKSIAQRMSGGPAESVDSLRRRLLEGEEALELGGYIVSPRLAKALHAVDYSIESLGFARRGLVLEIGTVAGESKLSLGAPKANAWKRDVLAGERFWAAVEPQRNDDLVQRSVSFLVDGE